MNFQISRRLYLNRVFVLVGGQSKSSQVTLSNLLGNMHLRQKVSRNWKQVFSCSVQLLSCVWLFATPWTAARQASLSITSCTCPLMDEDKYLTTTTVAQIQTSINHILIRPFPFGFHGKIRFFKERNLIFLPLRFLMPKKSLQKSQSQQVGSEFPMHTALVV